MRTNFHFVDFATAAERHEYRQNVQAVAVRKKDNIIDCLVFKFSFDQTLFFKFFTYNSMEKSYGLENGNGESDRKRRVV